MKCGALVLRKMSGGKKPKIKVARIFSMINRIVWKMPTNEKGKFSQSDLELCDGNIIATLEYESDGSGCPCCSEKYLIIRYRCDRCGNEHFDELPKHEIEKQVSALVTKWVSTVSEDLRREVIEQAVGHVHNHINPLEMY